MSAPVTFLILGGAGDLARRLLIPGIAEYLDEYPETGIRLIGSGRSPVEDYPRLIRKALSGRRSTADAPSRELADHARYLVADATDTTDLQLLIDAAGTGTRLILYFALSPDVTAHALAAGSTDTTTDILAATRIDQASVRRARYTAGRIDDRALPAYTDEEGVDPDHGTETLFQLTAWVATERWRGVPVTLRSGKAIGNPRREIIVTYHRHGSADELDINPGTRLIFPFTDDAAVEVNVSDHGYRDALQRVNLSSELVPSRLSAYGRVVRALARADTSSEVAAHDPVLSWEVIAPVLDAFTEDRVPLEEYPAGSRGPQGW